MPDAQGCYSQEEAASYLGVSVRTIHNYRQRGLLEGREEWKGLRRTWWYTQEQLDACHKRLNQERKE